MSASIRAAYGKWAVSKAADFYQRGVSINKKIAEEAKRHPQGRAGARGDVLFNEWAHGGKKIVRRTVMTGGGN